MSQLFPFIFAIILTTVLLPLLVRLGRRIDMVDRPSERRVHDRPIPRTGGIAIVIGAMVPLIFYLRESRLLSGICAGVAVLFVLGLLDDRLDLCYRTKFAGQGVAAVLTVLVGGVEITRLGEVVPGYPLHAGVLAIPLTVFFLMVAANSINLADGLDGLAAGICLLIFAASVLLGYIDGNTTVLLIGLCAGGALIGFLRYNTHPAIVFMGDTGSLFLGFMVGLTVLLLTQRSASYSPIFALFLLGLPVVDTAVVMLERAIERRPLFRADRNHLHHKLLALGLDHQQAVIAIYALQFGIIVCGLKLSHRSDLLHLAIYLLIVAVVVAGMVVFARHTHHPAPVDTTSKPAQANGLTRQPSWLGQALATTSKSAYVLLMASVWLFLLLSPFWIRPIPHDIGSYALILAVVLGVVRVLKPALLQSASKLSIYFLALYYISIFEFSGQVVLWYPERAQVAAYLFLVMGAAYSLVLVLTRDPVPVMSLDYLLLGVVLLTAFLPRTLLETYHIHKIAAKTLLLFLALEVVSMKMTRYQDILAAGTVTSLTLTFILAYWPCLL